jgi:hypothetical protein
MIENGGVLTDLLYFWMLRSMPLNEFLSCLKSSQNAISMQNMTSADLHDMEIDQVHHLHNWSYLQPLMRCLCPTEKTLIPVSTRNMYLGWHRF